MANLFDAAAVKQLFYSPYELAFAASGKESGKGILLKVFFDDGAGYTCLHSWPHFDDPSPQQFVELLRQRLDHPRLQRALSDAKIDAGGRRQRQSLFSGLSLPSSHVQVGLDTPTSWQHYRQLGFGVFKVKWDGESDLLPLLEWAQRNQVLLRIDGNQGLTPKNFQAWLQQHQAMLNVVDFFEDPTPYDPTQWRHWHENYQVRFAVDQDAEQVSCSSAQVLVVKPARDDVETMVRLAQKFDHEIVFTHYLDHPLGQAIALYHAAKVVRSSVDGFCTGDLFAQPHNSLSFFGSRPSAPMGYGFGFDEILEALPWQLL